MIARIITKLMCLAIGGAAGWAVFTNMGELFTSWVPPVAAVVAFGLVSALLYFPLARPVAEIIVDKLSVLMHRGSNIRAGTGLDSIPEKAPVNCSICGGPGGPICPICNKEMEHK